MSIRSAKTPKSVQSKPVIPRNDDSVDYEFKVYCILIRDLEPKLPENQEQREKLMRWIHLLVDPLTSAQDAELRVKRNRYLFMICSALMYGNESDFMKIIGQKHIKFDAKNKPVKVAGMRSQQQSEKISEANGIPNSISRALDPEKFEKFDAAPEWEKAKNWEMRLQTIQDAAMIALKEPKLKTGLKKPEKICTVHEDKCVQDPFEAKVGACLDNQFRYLLFMADYHPTAEDENASKWLQALAKVDKSSCTQMKGIRNDYMMLLVGYLRDRALKGPFEDLPTERLQPITQAVATYIAKRKNDQKVQEDGKVPLNPFSDTVEEFMSDVPMIEEGAFAFLSLSGNMLRMQR